MSGADETCAAETPVVARTGAMLAAGTAVALNLMRRLSRGRGGFGL